MDTDSIIRFHLCLLKAAFTSFPFQRSCLQYLFKTCMVAHTGLICQAVSSSTGFLFNPQPLLRTRVGCFRSRLQRQQDLCSLKYCTQPPCQRPIVAFIPFLLHASRLPGESLLAAVQYPRTFTVHPGHCGWFINDPFLESPSVSRIWGEESKHALFLRL